MFTVDMPVHIMIADGKGSSELYPGTVTKAGEAIEAMFDLMSDSPPHDMISDVVLFFELRGKFFQQKTTFGGFVSGTPGGPVTGTFYPIGVPESAEKRSIFRVCVATTEMKATVERERNCQVVDISPEGFAVIARGTYKPGTLVNVELPVGDDRIAGQGRIQTARVLGPARTRYGFFIPPSRQDMRKALQRLSVEAQRSQLKRMSRSA
jgi:hypothetical protein